MLKAYKYRIYPTKSQMELMEKTFGCVRFYWNKALEIKLKALERKEKIPQVLPAQLKKEYEFLKEVDSLALANAQLQFEKAIKDWLSKKTEKPKFKRKKDKQSYTTNNVNGSIRVDFEKGVIRLPKISHVKAKLHRTFEGTIRSATIRRTKTGKYFVSVLVEEEIRPLSETNRICAIDLGLKHFATICYSDGGIEKIESPRYFVKTQKKLAKEQRRLARKQKGSKKYEKQRLKVAKIHEKIRNQREDFLQKLSKRIVNENQAIILEDLNVEGLFSNGNLSKHIQDSSWTKFLQYLSYKAQWYRREVIFADRFYPSSKTCHICGYKKEDLKLSDREWICPVCGAKHDRDINAAKNLLQYGLAHLKGSRAGTARTDACGGAYSSDEAGSSMLYSME
ncbi:MAG: putative transposase [Thermotogaceae bacterium]|nr:putative transposase [Thermotogaceae bacterium]